MQHIKAVKIVLNILDFTQQVDCLQQICESNIYASDILSLKIKIRKKQREKEKKHV